MPKNEIDFNSRQAFNFLLKKDFHSFYNRTFLHLHQKRDFYYNWHIGAISEFLTGMRMESQILGFPLRIWGRLYPNLTIEQIKEIIRR